MSMVTVMREAQREGGAIRGVLTKMVQGSVDKWVGLSCGVDVVGVP